MDPLGYDYSGKDNAGSAIPFLLPKGYGMAKAEKRNPLLDSLGRDLMSFNAKADPRDAAAVAKYVNDYYDYGAKLLASKVSIDKDPSAYAELARRKQLATDAASKSLRDAETGGYYDKEMRNNPYSYTDDHKKALLDWYATPLDQRSPTPPIEKLNGVGASQIIEPHIEKLQNVLTPTYVDYTDAQGNHVKKNDLAWDDKSAQKASDAYDQWKSGVAGTTQGNQFTAIMADAAKHQFIDGAGGEPSTWNNLPPVTQAKLVDDFSRHYFIAQTKAMKAVKNQNANKEAPESNDQRKARGQQNLASMSVIPQMNQEYKQIANTNIYTPGKTDKEIGVWGNGKITGTFDHAEHVPTLDHPNEYTLYIKTNKSISVPNMVQDGVNADGTPKMVETSGKTFYKSGDLIPIKTVVGNPDYQRMVTQKHLDPKIQEANYAGKQPTEVTPADVNAQSTGTVDASKVEVNPLITHAAKTYNQKNAPIIQDGKINKKVAANKLNRKVL